MKDLREAFEQGVNLVQEHLELELELVTNDQGMIVAAEVDRIFAKYMPMLDRLVVAFIDDASQGRIEWREELRRELEPVREMLKKRIADRLKPH